MGKRRRKGADSAWRGDLEIDERSMPDGAFEFHGMSVPAYEMIVVPRIWDDPRRREREVSADEQFGRLAERFRGALDAWTGSVGELVRWLRYDRSRAPSRRRRSKPSPDAGDAGPETMH